MYCWANMHFKASRETNGRKQIVPGKIGVPGIFLWANVINISFISALNDSLATYSGTLLHIRKPAFLTIFTAAHGTEPHKCVTSILPWQHNWTEVSFLLFLSPRPSAEMENSGSLCFSFVDYIFLLPVYEILRHSCPSPRTGRLI